MSEQQAILFQYAVCGFLAYMVLSCLILTWQIITAKGEKHYVKQETLPSQQPYNILNEATEVAQSFWESEKTV